MRRVTFYILPLVIGCLIGFKFTNSSYAMEAPETRSTTSVCDSETILQTYRGIQPGKSSTSQVLNILGKPHVTNENVDYASKSSFTLWSYKKPRVTLFIRNDIVELIVAVPESDYPKTLKTWQAKYGKPEGSLPSPRGIGYRILIYPKSGFAATFNETDHLITLQFFPKTTVIDFEKDWYEPVAPFVR